MITKSHFTVLAASASVAGLSLFAATGTVHASMIVNGDFSANATAYTTFPGTSVSPNPTDPTGWTASAPSNAGVNGLDTGFYATQGAPFAPTSMAGVTDFAFIQSGILIGANISVVAGSSYQLSYEAAGRANTSGNAMQTIIYDDVANATYATQTPAINDAAFAPFTWTFTAPSNLINVVFANAGGTPDVTDVSLQAIPVPAPATLALVGVGALGVLLLKRHRTA